MNMLFALTIIQGVWLVSLCEKGKLKEKNPFPGFPWEKNPGKSEAPGNYSVSLRNTNRVCIKAHFTMTFDIEYFARNPATNRDYIELKKGDMPSSPSLMNRVGGRCMNQTESPFIFFQWDDGYYTLNISFRTLPQATGDLWYVHEVVFTYGMNSTKEFPNVAHSKDRTLKQARFVGRLFETPVGMSYSCSEPTRVTLTNDDDVYEVNLYMRKMQIQPTQIFDNHFSVAMPCDADLVPMGPEYSPHLHTSMALVLSIGVMGMMGMYSFYRRYRAKILPIPAIILGTLRSGDGIANAQFFPKEPKYEQEEN